MKKTKIVLLIARNLKVETLQGILILVAFVGFTNCKESTKEMKSEAELSKSSIHIEEEKYPAAFKKVLEAHGGLENWKEKQTLTFEIVKPNENEKHTIDLYSRRDKIEINEVVMGFDGNEIWLRDKQNTYNGNPAVYHNLMFYFYAMPFVLADPGINYETAEDLIYEGSTYPGFRISYNDGIGASPKDDYYVHYDPDTYQMAWLGYTFTYGSDKKSNDVKWIRYKDWMKVDAIVLPEYLTWHNYERRTIKEARDPLEFKQVSLDASSKPDSFYARPENAKVVLKP